MSYCTADTHLYVMLQSSSLHPCRASVPRITDAPPFFDHIFFDLGWDMGKVKWTNASSPSGVVDVDYAIC